MEFGGVSGQALSPSPLACTTRASRVPQHRAPYITQALATQATYRSRYVSTILSEFDKSVSSKQTHFGLNLPVMFPSIPSRVN